MMGAAHRAAKLVPVQRIAWARQWHCSASYSHSGPYSG